MAQVELLKKVGKYTDKEGREKQYTNFYVRCGDALIPIQVCFFANEAGKDSQYAGRKEVLKAFAELLPEKTENGTHKPNVVPHDGNDPF